jgi:transposase-like protein
MCVVAGIDIEEFKRVVGIWLGERESSKFWFSVLNDLRNRGVNDVLL